MGDSNVPPTMEIKLPLETAATEWSSRKDKQIDATQPVVPMKTIELEISLEIRKALESKHLNPASAMAIVRKGTELLSTYKTLTGAEKKALLVRVLEHISAGNDGILGTDDDLLPESTVKAIRALLDGSLLDDVVQTFVSIAKGNIEPEKIMSVGCRLKDVALGLFACLGSKKIRPAAPA